LFPVVQGGTMDTRSLVFVFAMVVLISNLGGCAPAGFDPNDPIVGVYSAQVSGDTLIVEKGSGQNGCFPTPGEGRYRWHVNGGVLTLTAIEDFCYREYVLASKPWVRKP
jgi:hypothetical protein